MTEEPAVGQIWDAPPYPDGDHATIEIDRIADGDQFVGVFTCDCGETWTEPVSSQWLTHSCTLRKDTP